MIESIVLTKFGETLLPLANASEEGILTGEVGAHYICNGSIFLIPVSSTHRVLLCRKCGLRLVIPVSASSYLALRKHCQMQIQGVEAPNHQEATAGE